MVLPCACPRRTQNRDFIHQIPIFLKDMEGKTNQIHLVPETKAAMVK